MHGKSKKHSRPGYIAALLITTFMLTGCGQILAGTPVDLGDTNTLASGSAHITWYDGYEILEADVKLGPSVDVKSVPFDVDTSRIPLDDTTCLKCFQITSDSDISKLYDVQMLDEEDKTLIYVNSVYDGAIYALGKGWYGVIMPNGFDQPYHIRIGNTYFETR